MLMLSEGQISFQSTRPRGARRNSVDTLNGLRCFNPRAREGRDLASALKCCENDSFNPRAREGRDSFPASPARLPISFNPRAREGRDSESFEDRAEFLVSIHAPARGATGKSPEKISR